MAGTIAVSVAVQSLNNLMGREGGFEIHAKNESVVLYPYLSACMHAVCVWMSVLWKMDCLSKDWAVVAWRGPTLWLS